jgi:hypothetical protein
MLPLAVTDTDLPAFLLDFIAQFTTDIRHVKGTDNPVADALSRIEANALLDSSPPVVDFVTMAVAQRSDPDLAHLQEFEVRLRKEESVPRT